MHSIEPSQHNLLFIYLVINVKIPGTVKPGMPEVSLPPFEINYNNRTLSFKEVCSELGTGIIVVPLVAVRSDMHNLNPKRSLIKY